MEKFEGTNGYVEEYYNENQCFNLMVPGLAGVQLLDKGLLGFGYMIFLIWLFLGISLIADMFMEAIEVITSTT